MPPPDRGTHLANATPSPTTVITGAGAVSAFGWGCAPLWSAVSEGRSGIRAVERFATAEFVTDLGATLSLHDDDHPPGRDADRFVRFACYAAREALQRAGFDERPRPRAARIALVLGASIEQGELALHRLVELVGDLLGFDGPRLTVSIACASATAALGLARDLLVADRADLVLAGGVDVLNAETFAGFSALGVLSTSPCAPFSTPLGTTLGEGAAIFAVERLAADQPAMAVLLGYGLSADAFQATAPEPQGAGVERAIRAALSHSDVPASAVGYVNVHGTGTEANDPAELLAMRRVFDDFGERVAFSSSKSIVGHAQGAAGALETLVTLQCMQRGMLPPTLHYAGPRPACSEDPIGQPRPRELAVSHAVCTNSAFGGANAAVVVARPARGLSSPTRPVRRRVRLAGVGVVGPFGTSLASLMDQPDATGAVPPLRLQDFVPRVDPRALYRSSTFLIAAAALALDDAGVRVRGRLADRAGLFAAIDRLSPSAAAHFRSSIATHGATSPSLRAFANMVVNAPAGACARSLVLKGPHNTLCCGPEGGLVAAILAAEHLAMRDDADLILAAACAELPEDDSPPSERLDGIGETGEATTEGAACVVLQAEVEHTSAPGSLLVEGWALAGPRDFESVLEHAFAMAHRREVEAVVAPDEPGLRSTLDRFGLGDVPITGVAARPDARAATSGFTLAAAVGRMRRDRLHSMVVLTPANLAVCGALVLSRSHDEP